MKISRTARAIATGALAIGGAVGVIATPAQAASPYFVCSLICDAGHAFGTITWHNRTATVTGYVTDVSATGSTTAVFEAFAGATKIDSQTRTANDGSSLGSPRYYDFPIGDTELVGGIDRIKITVCWDYATPSQVCGLPDNYSKP